MKYLIYRLANLLYEKAELPRSFLIEPTSVCNFRCEYCSTLQGDPKKSPKPHSMRFEDFRKILRQIGRFPLYRPNISFVTRGEPFINKDFAKFISLASSKKLHTLASTNASLLRPEISEELIRARLNHIIFSIDGFSKDTYESHRIGGKFEEVKKNIESFLEIKKASGSALPLVEIQMIVTRLNFHEAERCEDHFLSLGADLFARKTLRLPNMGRDLSITESLIEKYHHEEYSRYENPLDQIREKGKIEDRSRTGECSWKYSFSILANGEISLCCQDLNDHRGIGNAFRDGLWKLWFSEKYRKVREMVGRRAFADCEYCD